jgi:hypothetical protein
MKALRSIPNFPKSLLKRKKAVRNALKNEKMGALASCMAEMPRPSKPRTPSPIPHPNNRRSTSSIDVSPTQERILIPIPYALKRSSAAIMSVQNVSARPVKAFNKPGFWTT